MSEDEKKSGASSAYLIRNIPKELKDRMDKGAKALGRSKRVLILDAIDRHLKDNGI